MANEKETDGKRGKQCMVIGNKNEEEEGKRTE